MEMVSAGVWPTKKVPLLCTDQKAKGEKRETRLRPQGFFHVFAQRISVWLLLVFHHALCVFVCVWACTWHAPVDRCSSPVLLLQNFFIIHPSPPPPSPPLFAQRLGAIIGAHVARCSNLCAVHTKDERHLSRVCRGWADPQAQSCTAACRTHASTQTPTH